jgi:hypothetical protein
MQGTIQEKRHFICQPIFTIIREVTNKKSMEYFLIQHLSINSTITFTNLYKLDLVGFSISNQGHFNFCPAAFLNAECFKSG